MGYYAGVFDLVGMRLIEILEAVPRLMLLLAITAMVGRNLYLMMLVIGLTGWMGDARFIRAEFLKLRKQDFVQAAIAAGLPMRSVLFRHMLPNGISPVLVTASFGIAAAILLETTLSFLGLGLIDEPSWGQLLNQARAGGRGFVWWLAVFPGLAIFLTVFAYTLIGEAVRDALDPKLRKRE
jgi:peptide/nickel transport system permease protein